MARARREPAAIPLAARTAIGKPLPAGIGDQSISGRLRKGLRRDQADYVIWKAEAFEPNPCGAMIIFPLEPITSPAPARAGLQGGFGRRCRCRPHHVWP